MTKKKLSIDKNIDMTETIDGNGVLVVSYNHREHSNTVRFYNIEVAYLLDIYEFVVITDEVRVSFLRYYQQSFGSRT
jgi:hypothetical protein